MLEAGIGGDEKLTDIVISPKWDIIYIQIENLNWFHCRTAFGQQDIKSGFFWFKGWTETIFIQWCLKNYSLIFIWQLRSEIL